MRAIFAICGRKVNESKFLIQDFAISQTQGWHTGSVEASFCLPAAFIRSIISLRSSARRRICESIFSANW